MGNAKRIARRIAAEDISLPDTSDGPRSERYPGSTTQRQVADELNRRYYGIPANEDTHCKRCGNPTFLELRDGVEVIPPYCGSCYIQMGSDTHKQQREEAVQRGRADPSPTHERILRKLLDSEPTIAKRIIAVNYEMGQKVLALMDGEWKPAIIWSRVGAARSDRIDKYWVKVGDADPVAKSPSEVKLADDEWLAPVKSDSTSRKADLPMIR